ncbi:MAG: GNAT family N-acetyltransferase [Stigonema ocellatum SAG 48.90 = DSM 106950]|nr:GNAT family N-acetyltransferase [Stigonema ocellatum SAG 48.90 = DSM 106950]
MDVKFRACTEADLPIVQNYVLSLYSKDPSGMEMTPKKIQNTFEEFILRPEKGRIIVFDIDKTVVGYAILVFFWSNEFGGDVIEVDELFVQEDYRNRGIGKIFFQWLQETWHSKAVALALQTTPTNKRAMAFYQRLGFSLSKNFHLIKVIKPQEQQE